MFAANRQAEGFRPLEGEVFQKTEQVFSYSGATVDGSTTTLSLVTQTMTNDASGIAAPTELTSTPIATTSAAVDIGLPAMRGASGERSPVSAQIGTGGAQG